jgi:hypothetical protein
LGLLVNNPSETDTDRINQVTTTTFTKNSLGRLINAGDRDGELFTVATVSSTGGTLTAKSASTGDVLKFVVRKDGQFRMTGKRTGFDLEPTDRGDARSGDYAHTTTVTVTVASDADPEVVINNPEFSTAGV